MDRRSSPVSDHRACHVKILLVNSSLGRLTRRDTFLKLQWESVSGNRTLCIISQTHQNVHLAKGTVLGFRETEVTPKQSKGSEASPEKSLERKRLVSA